jgi:hypothetical protein
VRIPLNEDCWLGINGAPAAYSGTAYQQAIHEFVAALHEAGIYAILDLHWNAPGAQQANGLRQMADLDHSLDFWRSLALSFREDPAVLFDLYSEPHDIDWECWLAGCTPNVPEGGAWRTAGMQSLVDAVRSQGATQPLLLGGLEWANDLSGWLAHLPIDSQHQLVASLHIYPNNPCNSVECWSGAVAAVARVHPVVAGELGEFDCAHSFIEDFMSWADANGVSYLGWSWNTYDCATGPSLIESADGAPTAFGQGLRDHLQMTSPSLVNSPPPEPPPLEEPAVPPTATGAETPPPPPPSASAPAPGAGAGTTPTPAAVFTPTPSPPKHKTTRKHKVKKHRARRAASRIATGHRVHRHVTKTPMTGSRKRPL